jgi:anti-sigma B factor antagonist
MDLTIASEPGPSGAVRLRLSGAVDLASRDELLNSGKDALSHSPGLLLNLSDVQFMDSTGIGVLIDLSHEADDQGKSFAIEEPSQRVLRILTLTGLQDAWTVLPAPEG